LLCAACTTHSLRGADPARPIELPADHGAHDDAQTEWWHFHGHLADDEGRRYDFLLVFVRQHTDLDRIALVPMRWFVDPYQQAWLTWTDRARGAFSRRDKYAWPDTWAADASSARLELRHDSWRAWQVDEGAVELRASTHDAELALKLEVDKPPVRMGRGGFVRFPPRSDHYYYSYPRMHASGSVVTDGERRAVQGLGWLKHEWGFLYSDLHSGWLWFGLQLSNSTEIVVALVYDLEWNLADGSFAVVIEPDGTKTSLALADLEVVQTGETWRSPETGTAYPTSWLLRLPGGRASLLLKAVVPGQEMVGMPANMWAGALDVRGTFDGQEVTGDCFSEHLGLDVPFGRSLFQSGRPTAP